MLRFLYRRWLCTIASTAIVLGRKRRALQIYEEIVTRFPRDELARTTVGNLYMELAQPQRARAAFEALLAINPANAIAWFNLGFVHDLVEANADAERCFAAALARDPTLDRAWYGLGLVLIREGRLAEAVVALKRNTQLQPFSPYGWFQLAMAHQQLGQSEDAWRIHASMARFEPRFAATLERDLKEA